MAIIIVCAAILLVSLNVITNIMMLFEPSVYTIGMASIYSILLLLPQRYAEMPLVMLKIDKSGHWIARTLVYVICSSFRYSGIINILVFIFTKYRSRAVIIVPVSHIGREELRETTNEYGARRHVDLNVRHIFIFDNKARLIEFRLAHGDLIEEIKVIK